jgi:hypothetical protein
MSIVAHKQDCAGHFVILNGGLNDGIENVQVRCGIFLRETRRAASDPHQQDDANVFAIHFVDVGPTLLKRYF